LMRFYVEAFMPKLFKVFELNSAAKYLRFYFEMF